MPLNTKKSKIYPSFYTIRIEDSCVDSDDLATIFIRLTDLKKICNKVCKHRNKLYNARIDYENFIENLHTAYYNSEIEPKSEADFWDSIKIPIEKVSDELFKNLTQKDIKFVTSDSVFEFIGNENKIIIEEVNPILGIDCKTTKPTNITEDFINSLIYFNNENIIV